MFADLRRVGKTELSSPVLLGMAKYIRILSYFSSEIVTRVKKRAWTLVPLSLNLVKETKEQLAQWLMTEWQQTNALF